MTADEVRLLDNKYALVFIRGERPVRDLKYDILAHPNIKLGADGGAEEFVHNVYEPPESVQIEIVKLEDFPGKKMEDFPEVGEYFKTVIEAYDEEETEELCKQIQKKLEEQEKQQNEKKQE